MSSKGEGSSSQGSKSLSIFTFGKSNQPAPKRDDGSTILSNEQEEVRPFLNTNTNTNTKSMEMDMDMDIGNDATLRNRGNKKKYAFRQDSMGYSADDHHAGSDVQIGSLTYLDDESEAYRAYNAANHYYHRGTYWNEGKRQVMVRYFQLAMIGLLQGSVAYFTNFFSHLFIEVRTTYDNEDENEDEHEDENENENETSSSSIVIVCDIHFSRLCEDTTESKSFLGCEQDK